MGMKPAMKPKQPEKKWEERWRKRLEKISVYANEQVTGYVIPINEATDFISQLIDEKEIERLIAESKEEALKEVEIKKIASISADVRQNVMVDYLLTTLLGDEIK
jgi:hypothetical protein